MRRSSQRFSTLKHWPLGLVLLYSSFCTACTKSEDSPPRPRVSGVLITLDTTNVRALDMYGPDRKITPNLVAFAGESVIFDKAHTVAPITLPAHTSMLTGLYPLRHGVRDNGLMALSEDATTLAEIASEAGCETAAFVAARVLSRPFGIAQGFDVFDEPINDPNTSVVKHIVERRAPEVTNRALEWLRNRDGERPFFLWVHYFDPHDPYEPEPQFLEMADGRSYFGEVAAMDHEVGRLLDALRRDVGFENCVIGVVADHGEALYRHGEPTHTALIYEDTMHVPFLLRFPDGRRAGQRSQEIVSVVDVFPTFLDEMGLAGPSGLDGLSLASAGVPEDRGVFLESYSGFLNYGWSPLTSWLDARGKYVHSSKPEFYDLAADPGEKSNLIDQEGVEVTSYRQAIRELSALPRLDVVGDVKLSAERLRELRALGYAAAGDVDSEILDPLDPTELPAPIDRIEAHAALSNALAAIYSGGDRNQAIELMLEIVTENPNNMYAQETLGGVLMETGRFDEAQILFEGLVARGKERFPFLASLGWLHARQGNLKESVRYYERAMELRPEEAQLEKQLDQVRKRLNSQ